MFSAEEIERLSQEFETKTPQEIIRWAVDSFWPQIALSSSFQTQSMPLLHMASRIRRDLLVFFLDTGYHFWDTLIFREQIASEWHLNVLDLYRDTRWDVFTRQHTRTLPVQDPNLCCFLNKVQPMQKALKDMKAWISGIRRDQTSVRAHAKDFGIAGGWTLEGQPAPKLDESGCEKVCGRKRPAISSFIGEGVSQHWLCALYRSDWRQ